MSSPKRFQSFLSATAIRSALASLSICLLLFSSSIFVSAGPTVLPVTPGWDAFDAGSGFVTYNLKIISRRQRKLQITYTLKGAKPLQKYDLAIGIFYAPGTSDGLKFFGVSRFLHETHTKENVTKTIDGFIVGKMSTDRFGNGQTHVDLDLSSVPPGTYNAQFTWTQLSDLRCHYRTGTKYGQDFAKIVLP